MLLFSLKRQFSITEDLIQLDFLANVYFVIHNWDCNEFMGTWFVYFMWNRKLF